MLPFPLNEADLFNTHWDDDWNITWQSKGSRLDEELRKLNGGGDNSQRYSDDKGQNDKQDDKKHEEDDVEQIREEISKVIENVMRTSVDRDVEPAPSYLGVQFPSSPFELRHRAFPSRPESSPRGLPAAEQLASSPPAGFETHHNHNQQPIRETIEHSPETPNVSPTLRFSKPVHPENALVHLGELSSEEESSEEDLSEEDSSEEESSDDESVIAESVQAEICETAAQEEPGAEVSSEDSSEEDLSEEDSSDDEEEEEFVGRPSGNAKGQLYGSATAPNEPSPVREARSSSSAETSSSMEASSSSSAMQLDSDLPSPFEEYSVLGDEDDVKIYAICLEGYLDEMDDDHEALTGTWLARARLYQRPAGYTPKNRDGPRRDPFTNLKPSKTGRTVTLTGKAISQSKPRGETIRTSVRVSSSKATSVASTEVPNYTHYTRISANVLGTNTRQLQVWPYFGEDVDDDGTIRERFDVIVEDRPRKVLISQQASTYGPYFLAFLQEIGCPIEVILKYLLEACEGPDGLLSRLKSFSDDDKLARKLVRAKEKYCRDDFDRTSQRWVSVASSLPEIDDETLWKAAVVCHAFWIRTKFSPWQLARKYAKFPDNNKIEGLVTFDEAEKYANVACSICQLHDCPFHGTILERPNGRDDSDEEDVNSVDALDIDYPPRVNFKELATAPQEREPLGITSRSQPKKSLNWWMNEANSVTWDHSQRGPFFPCSHVGISCEDARCTCFEAQICCEKTCGCSKNCSRRFEGCKCARRSKCCAQDDSCECFRMNRECDPDLCDSCEAHVILNPVNRYDDDYLPQRCRNVAIQRSVPKRTLLGRSPVHGFGLYAGEPIAKDEFIGEYQGEIITRDETERRGAIYDFQKLSYIFDLNRDQTVDSQRMGNKIRFINHAAKLNQRNVYPKIMLCNLAHRIGMFAHRDIKVGEELFFDYGGSYHEKLYGEEQEQEKARKEKSKGKGKAVVTHIRPSRKSYQPQPEIMDEAPGEIHDDTYRANDNHSSDSEDSEDERPTKRIRRSRLSSPKRQKIPPPENSRLPPRPLEKALTKSKFSARKTEDRTRVRGGSNTTTPATVGKPDQSRSKVAIEKTSPFNLKAAMKSANLSKALSRSRSRVVVEKSDDESEEESDDDSDDEDEVPRRSSRPRKVSRKLREDA